MKRTLVAAFLLAAMSFMSFAQDAPAFRTASIFSDHMVFQRDTIAPVWGWAEPGTRVTVTPSWNGKKYSGTADSEGRWEVKVQTPEAGGPYSVKISSKAGKIVLEDVLSGEVWLCSGQSNMELPVLGAWSQPVVGGVEAILSAPSYMDRIRVVNIKADKKNEPQQDIDNSWEIPDGPVTARTSAVAYFFARQLSGSLGVPVGIICNPWGGCLIEPWMTREYIDAAVKGKISDKDYQTILDRRDDPSMPPIQMESMYNSRMYPIKGFALRGFLWYQGCGNMYNFTFYDKLQQQMVRQWRDMWGDTGDRMPFYFVSIAPFNYSDPNDPTRAYFVENQLNSLDLIPNSGAAVTETLGEGTCIHPARKQEVARQLCLLALERTYSVSTGLGCGFPYPESVVFPASSSVEEGSIRQSGFPVQISRSAEDDGKITVVFANAASGLGGFSDQLKNEGAPVHGFEVAGPDRVFHPVEAKALYNKVYIDCSGIGDPVALRYGFRNCSDADLVCVMGAPVPSFRTDNW
ncbi:MAG: sialate O-acetylesterase [Candidatus Cryptobacteroides sp.]